MSCFTGQGSKCYGQTVCRSPRRWGGGAHDCLGWLSKASEGMASEISGFPSPSGAAEREPCKQWKQNVQRHRSWRGFVACRDPRVVSGTVLIHQTLLMVLRFHMYVRGQLEDGWMEAMQGR